MKSVLSFVLAAFLCTAVIPSSAQDVPPSPMREFRGSWVATVANIDWPTEPGLSTEEQKAEAIKHLDAAVDANLNAIVFQVRPQAGALYASEIEPWSYYLTGEQGKAPEPYYDPLEFWVEEAHKRGLELHTWYNPYRAKHPNMKGELAENSIVNTRPDLVAELKQGYYWMIPTEPEVQDWTINVVMDVVRRYDIDGVHFDDYFYPYSSYNGGEDFPDDEQYKEYKDGGGELSRGDWRRKGVDDFIERLYKEIKAEKPHVKFGISPFGIWRPGNPSSIKGLDQYDSLYADAKLWFNEGWVDYFTPQLYWPINYVPQSYPVLLGWWKDQNLKNRHLWPGLSISGVNEKGGDESKKELINQILVTRGIVRDYPGNVLFSHKGITNNRVNMVDALKDGLTERAEGVYAEKALIPPFPWLDDEAPKAPQVGIMDQNDQRIVMFKADDEDGDLFQFVVYIKQGRSWKHAIITKDEDSVLLPNDATAVAISAVDRFFNESEKTVVKLEPKQLKKEAEEQEEDKEDNDEE